MPHEQPTVAYLLKKFPRLSETFILNEILGQEARGRRLRVFSRRPADDEPRHPQMERLQAPVEVLPRGRKLDPWGTLFAEGGNPEVLFARVHQLVQANRERPHPRFPGLLAEALYLLDRTRQLGIRHLHVHFASDAAIVAMLLRHVGGPSFSLTTHAKDIYRTTVDPVLLSRVVKASEFTVTVCDANLRHMKELLSPEASSRLRRLYNGIDLRRFDPAPSSERDEGHVLAVGRLVEKKGLHVLLDALALLMQAGIAFQVTVVGQGEEREALVRQASELGLNGHLRWTGPLDQGRVVQLMSRATVFCLPCIVGKDGNRDALPTVLIEALASGLPVVSTPISGIPEILEEGRAGIIVPPNDPQATARALEELLSNPERRVALSRAGRRRAEECFDVQQAARELATWLDDASISHSARAS